MQHSTHFRVILSPDHALMLIVGSSTCPSSPVSRLRQVDAAPVYADFTPTLLHPLPKTMSVLSPRARTAFRDLPWADAGHAAIVSAAPAILAVLLGEPRLGWSAIAAFWACFADPGGPLPQRLRAMGWVAAIGALFCFLGSVTQNALWLLLPLTFLCCTVASFAQLGGPASAIIGTLVSAGFVVSTELPTHGLADSAAYAAFFIGGGVWSILLTALVWRRRPWRYATAAVAQCYIEIADYANALGMLYLPSRSRHLKQDDATDTLRQQWSEVSDVHRKALRAQIETARRRVQEVLSSRPSRMNRGQQLLSLLDAAEGAFVVLVALADTMASVAAASASVQARASDDTAQRLRDAVLLRVLHRFAQACQVIARLSDVGDSAQRQQLQSAIARADQAVRQAHTASQAGDVLTPALLPLLDRLFGAGADAASALLTNAPERRTGLDGPGHQSEPTVAAAGPAWRQWLRLLRNNLHPSSSILRHAIRVGVAATISVALCHIFNINHGYWMSLTVVFILQPYLASTWQRTTERILGSVAGAVGASLVGALLPSPLAVAIAVLPIAIGTFVGRTIHYAVFTFFVTLQFVMVAEIQQPALHEFTLAGLRAMNSIYGGLLGLVIGILLWPERSRQRLAAILAEALERHAIYIRAVLRPAPYPSNATPLSTLRRDACLSADNAQIVLHGLQRSPMHGRQGTDAVAQLISALRGMTAAATVLELQPLSEDFNASMANEGANHDNEKDRLVDATTTPSTLPHAAMQETTPKSSPAYGESVGAALELTAAKIRREASANSKASAAAATAANTTADIANMSFPETDARSNTRAADPRSFALQRIGTLAQRVLNFSIAPNGKEGVAAMASHTASESNEH